MEKNNEIEIYYTAKVDLAFQTYRKAMLDCITDLSQHLALAGSFESNELQKIVNLLNILNNQVNGVSKFIEDYAKIKEIAFTPSPCGNEQNGK